MKEINSNILSDIIVHMKYAKYNPDLQRRETWNELVDRNMAMHIKKYPSLEVDIRKALVGVDIPTADMVVGIRGITRETQKKW